MLANVFRFALTLLDTITYCAGDMPPRLLLVLEILGTALVKQVSCRFEELLTLRRRNPIEVEHGQYVAFELPVQLGQMSQAHDGHGMSQVSPALFGFFGEKRNVGHTTSRDFSDDSIAKRFVRGFRRNLMRPRYGFAW